MIELEFHVQQPCIGVEGPAPNQAFNRSVVLTEEGFAEAERLFKELFGRCGA